LLMSDNRSLKIERLEDRCVEFFEENFCLRVEFNIREKIKDLLDSGLIKQDEEILTAIPLEEANVRSSLLITKTINFGIGIADA